MALKVKAKEQLIKIGKYADTYRHVMKPDLPRPFESMVRRTLRMPGESSVP